MKTFKKVAIILGSLIIISIAGLIFIFTWQGSSKEIVAVADKFQVPSSWKLESEMIRPPKIICLDGGSCPEVTRAWTLDKQLLKKDFNKILKNSELNFSIEGSCLLPENFSGSVVYLCDAKGSVDNYEFSIWAGEDTSTHKQRVTIDIRPSKR